MFPYYRCFKQCLKIDILDKIQYAKSSPPEMYMSHEDETYFKENLLFSLKYVPVVRNRRAEVVTDFVCG